MMATTGSSKSYAILYGWAEGTYHSRRLRIELDKACFRLAAHPTDAAIIIAHSAGCYSITDSTSSRCIVLINPPYWPGKSVMLSGLQKIWRDAVHHVRLGMTRQWIIKMMWHTWYGCTNPLGAYKALRALQKPPFMGLSTAVSVTVIRNRNDPWCTPNIMQYMSPTVNYVEHSGEHDDCWVSPQSYAAIIAKAAESAN